ncbi:MAG TPA: sulfatase [Terriglobales bacterium]|jgi:arylsulfatase A-like enzyme|nr:sulfatase [Terriglobales bacterium]
MESQKSILLVTVDCLRADHVGFMGYPRGTTPFLDTLAAESFVVPNAIVAGAPTYYSLPAIFASRYPLALGRDIVGLGADEPTIASTLKHAGHATAAFGAGNPYISSRFGYEQGFDTFRDYLDGDVAPSELTTGPENGVGWASRLNRSLQQRRKLMGPLGIVYDELYFRYCQRVIPAPASLDALRRFPAADVIVDHASNWLASIGDRPFFLWLHLMDPHSPYYPKDEALALMGQSQVRPPHVRYSNSYWNRSDLAPGRFEGRREEIIALYDAGIRWADEQLRRLVEWLRAANRWNDCIFALTADHGEEFLDHGGRYHPPANLMEELIHVPLLLRVPGIAAPQTARTPFSLIHLAPTLLDCAGLAVPGEFRRSYWPELQSGKNFDDAAISECIAGCTNPFRAESRMGPRVLSVRESRYKLVLHFDPAAENLYDLESDPGEQSPLSTAAQKPVRRRLLETAREHLRRSSEERDWRSRMQARLRELQLEWDKPADNAAPVAC